MTGGDLWGLVGAIIWNLLTWLLGLPWSSSYACRRFDGGDMGVAESGAIELPNVVAKILVPLALSPIVAGPVALAATWVAYRLAARADRVVGPGFPGGTVVSASLVALATRHQRRAEDDGRAHPDVDHCNSAASALCAAALGHRRRRPLHRTGHRHRWFGDPRVQAPGDALSVSPLAVTGITNKSLRALPRSTA